MIDFAVAFGLGSIIGRYDLTDHVFDIYNYANQLLLSSL